MNEFINWGIIGCGDVTEVKSGPAYQKVSGFKLEAVMRRDFEKCKDYAQRHHVPKAYADAEALINDPDIQAVYIATPPDSHKAYALRVAEAGKICCIEKPMAPSFEECKLINEAFQRKNIPLFVAYYRRSLPRFQHVKFWLDEGLIGTPRHINWHLSKPANTKDLSKTYNWRTDAAIAYGGYFDDLASHGIDLFMYLLGDIDKAEGLAVNQQNLYTAMDAVTGLWLHDSGVTGSGSWNFGGYEREEKVEIYGSKGKIVFSVFEEAPLELETKFKKECIHIPNPENIQLYHVQNMHKHLIQESIHPSTGTTAMKTSWVLDRILGKK